MSHYPVGERLRLRQDEPTIYLLWLGGISPSSSSNYRFRCRWSESGPLGSR